MQQRPRIRHYESLDSLLFFDCDTPDFYEAEEVATGEKGLFSALLDLGDKGFVINFHGSKAKVDIDISDNA